MTTAENLETGLQALERARAIGRPFLLVLLDSALPDSRGPAAAAAIRRQSPDTSMIVLLLSAHVHDELERDRQLGVNDWLAKPVKYLDLRRAVEALMGASNSVRHDSRGDRVHPSPSDPSARRLKILLADDNRVGLVIGEWMLRELGHFVETASDGRQVLLAQS